MPGGGGSQSVDLVHNKARYRYCIKNGSSAGRRNAKQKNQPPTHQAVILRPILRRAREMRRQLRDARLLVREPQRARVRVDVVQAEGLGGEVGVELLFGVEKVYVLRQSSLEFIQA